MRQKIKKTYLELTRTKLVLILCMAFIGGFTVFASANTYEVVSRKDVPFTSVITTVQITSDRNLDAEYRGQASADHKIGSFGIPQKIKLPETKQHIDIATYSNNERGWLASKGLAQTFVTGNERQKVFGQAVIYGRYQTATTQNLGDVINDDVLNIVTTEGWQLGYQVTDTSDDPSRLPKNVNAGISQVIVILINDKDGSITSFQASLIKVGDRI